MVAAGVMGCGSDSSDASADANTDTTASDTTANADTTDGADLSGTVTLAGSTSMEKLANAMNEAFMEKYPNVSATAEFTGSSAGIESLETVSQLLQIQQTQSQILSLKILQKYIPERLQTGKISADQMSRS